MSAVAAGPQAAQGWDRIPRGEGMPSTSQGERGRNRNRTLCKSLSFQPVLRFLPPGASHPSPTVSPVSSRQCPLGICLRRE